MADSRRDIDVRKIAGLARLTLAEGEAERFEPQLAKILAYIAQLDELDTSNVEATSHVVPLSAPLRDDTVTPGLAHDEALSQAPKVADGAVVVPKFVEGT